MLFTSKVAFNGPCSVSFPLTFGFGCGTAMKVTQGQRLSLQTQHKISSQLSAKLGALGTEIGSSVGAEISETLTHEISTNSEWSYTSRPCEYCNPQVHFPNARVKIISRRFLHLPLFVTRRTVFVPGEPYEIHAHCRHAPEKRENCAEAQVSAGSGSVLTATGTGGPTHLERVIFAARTPADYDLRQFLKEIISTPNQEAAPEQLYLHEFEGKVRAVHWPDGRYHLYSLDDIDRALGAVRVSPGVNCLFLLTKEHEKRPAHPSSPIIELVDEDADSPLGSGKFIGDARHGGFRLIRVELIYPEVKTMPEHQALKMRVSGDDTTDEWPAILVWKAA